MWIFIVTTIVLSDFIRYTDLYIFNILIPLRTVHHIIDNYL